MVIGQDGKPVTEVQEIQVPAFKIVSVFDVSQTEGEPLPSIGMEELTGSVERYEEFFKALEQTSPVPMSFEDIPGGSHGYYHLAEQRIAIQEGMSSKSCAYTVPVLLIRLAIWLMLTPIFCSSAVCARTGPVSIWTI